jgi:hypothetical protein
MTGHQLKGKVDGRTDGRTQAAPYYCSEVTRSLTNLMSAISVKMLKDRK